MSARRPLLLGFVAALAVAADASAKEKANEPHLRYVPTYEEAMAEARERNVPIFVAFHKDG
jgi:hypothetical protein